MLFRSRLDLTTVRTALLIALAANTVSKLVAASTSGGRGYVARLLPGLLLGTGGAWAASRFP